MADLHELLEQSKATDPLALLKAKEAAKQKMIKNPDPASLRVMEKAQAGLDRLSQPAPTGLTFQTQLEAAEYLAGQGFQVGRSKFNSDFKAGRIPTTPEGLFEASALMAYARARCKVVAQSEDQAAARANLERTKADAENKRIMAERASLKLEQEKGNLIARDEHERDLAARALFFKREIETFGQRLGAEIITLVGGDPEKLPAFVDFWEDRSADWLDAFSVEREFGGPRAEGDSASIEAPKAEALPLFDEEAEA